MNASRSLGVRDAVKLFDGKVDVRTLQRAIASGDLPAQKSGSARNAAYRFGLTDLRHWAAARELTMVANGHEIDPATGEVLEEREVAPSSANASLPPAAEPAQSVPPRALTTPLAPRPAPRDAEQLRELGTLDAVRRVLALEHSPELWAALRAIVGVGA